MHALNRVAAVTRDPVYLRWALELARAAHAAFTYQPSDGGQKRMYWKMSIDLSRPWSVPWASTMPWRVRHVPPAPVGGGAVGVTARRLPISEREIRDLAGICRGGAWVTEDPLGIGGLLSDAAWISRMIPAEDRYRNLLEHVWRRCSLGWGSSLKAAACSSLPVNALPSGSWALPSVLPAWRECMPGCERIPGSMAGTVHSGPAPFADRVPAHGSCHPPVLAR